MNKCPKVGDRVAYPGGLTIGPCTGVVTEIYRTYFYDEDALEAADTALAVYLAERGLRPEQDWHVAIKVDTKPKKWCYGKTDQFAPEVKALRRCRVKKATIICGKCEHEWPGPADGPCPKCGYDIPGEHVCR